ncbi:MAG: alkaline shock response membrane anchor protein AmaP [Sphingomonadaceae bacterium]
MNLFNRILVSLILLVFIVATLLVSLLPRPVIETLRDVLTAASLGLDSSAQLVGAAIGLAAAGAAFLLLLAELRPSARQSVVVTQGAAGTAELTNDSVAMRVKRVAETVAGVREAQPSVRSHGKAVDVLLRLSTDADLDLPKKSEEVLQAVRDEIENKMGIQIKSLKVTVKHGGGGPRPTPLDPEVAPKDPFRV